MTLLVWFITMSLFLAGIIARPIMLSAARWHFDTPFFRQLVSEKRKPFLSVARTALPKEHT
jgi:hypothetical protein